jgi:DNA-binding NarL/FixJ family response regulator
MAGHDIGSLVVMEYGDLVGMLTFREVIAGICQNGGAVGKLTVRTVMDDAPLTCTPETEIDEVRRMMLGRHARYMPAMDGIDFLMALRERTQIGWPVVMMSGNGDVPSAVLAMKLGAVDFVEKPIQPDKVWPK